MRCSACARTCRTEQFTVDDHSIFTSIDLYTGSDIRSMSSIRPICKCRCPPLLTCPVSLIPRPKSACLLSLPGKLDRSLHFCSTAWYPGLGLPTLTARLLWLISTRAVLSTWILNISLYCPVLWMWGWSLASVSEATLYFFLKLYSLVIWT